MGGKDLQFLINFEKKNQDLDNLDNNKIFEESDITGERN